MAVTKAPARQKKTPAAKKPAAKTVVKKTTVAKKSAPAPKAKTLDTQVPVKENVDVVNNVLSIKAHNEEVKQEKAQKKAAKKPVQVAPKATVVAPAKSVAERNKSKVVKEKAQKVAVKKFVLEKETIVEKAPKTCCCGGCGIKNGIIGAWARAYKNIFNYKGRTSRYEYWAYALFNMFFAFFIGAGLSIVAESTVARTGQPCAWCEGFSSLMTLVWGLVAISLTVRRLHDCGYAAWKGFFRPTVAWCIVLFLLFIASTHAQLKTTDINATGLSVLARSLAVVAVVAFVSVIYYCTKICIVSGFYEEEKADNAYGAPMYNDDCYKKYGIRYAGLLITAFIIMIMIYLAYMVSIALSILNQIPA